MVSLLLRPLVCPAVPKVTPEKRLEVRFFAPGGLVSNLDFVESIFGNAGDPLPARERRRPRRRRLDRPQRLRHPRAAPHSACGRRTSACRYEREDELYNDGSAFKLTSRGPRA